VVASNRSSGALAPLNISNFNKVCTYGRTIFELSKLKHEMSLEITSLI
jgi:hypothetical protein